MKKIILALSTIALVASMNSYAQVAKATSTTQATFTSKDSALCKPWKFASTEAFGVENPPTENQKSDMTTFTGDGTIFLIKDGKSQTGTWALDKGRTYINLTFPDTKQQMKFKLMKVDDKHLKYEYQDEHLIRTVYNFEAVKK